MSFNWGFSDVDFMARARLWHLGRKTRDIKSHSSHIVSRVHTVNMTYHFWCWPWLLVWGGVCLVSPLLLQFPYYSLWVKSHYLHPYYVESLGSPSWEWGIYIGYLGFIIPGRLTFVLICISHLIFKMEVGNDFKVKSLYILNCHLLPFWV